MAAEITFRELLVSSLSTVSCPFTALTSFSNLFFLSGICSFLSIVHGLHAGYERADDIRKKLFAELSINYKRHGKDLTLSRVLNLATKSFSDSLILRTQL